MYVAAKYLQPFWHLGHLVVGQDKMEGLGEFPGKGNEIDTCLGVQMQCTVIFLPCIPLISGFPDLLGFDWAAPAFYCS